MVYEIGGCSFVEVSSGTSKVTMRGFLGGPGVIGGFSSLFIGRVV